MNCATCREIFQPYDPSVRRFKAIGETLPSACERCYNPERDVIEIPPTSFEIPLPCTECPTHKQFLGLRGELEHLKTKVTELRAKKQRNEAQPFKE